MLGIVTYRCGRVSTYALKSIKMDALERADLLPIIAG